MRDLFGFSATALERLFGLEGLQALLLCLLHFLDLLFLITSHLGEAFLLAFHFCELLFLKDLHAGDLKCFAAEYGEDRLNFVVEKEKLIVLSECFF